jgi:TFIIIC subunit triple barrel domain
MDSALPEIGLDEYEYQYDDIQTETVLVDLDLTSLNGVTKSSKGKKSLNNGTQVDAAPSKGSDDDPAPTPNAKTKTSQKRDTKLQQPLGSVQLLDLDTESPIISFNNEIYECTWTDMIGTNIFFSEPGVVSAMEATQSNKDYALLGTSRIKLLGNHAKLLKPDMRKRKLSKTAGEDTELPDAIAGSAAQNKTSKQADFLESVMAVKRRRRETDEADPVAATPGLGMVPGAE